MDRLISLLGLFVMFLLAWLLSNNKRQLKPRIIVGGLFLQFLFAIIILRTEPGLKFFEWANYIFTTILSISDQGAMFIFGEDFKEHYFAFKVLPVIIFMSSLSYLLFYWGILQRFIALLAKLMDKVMDLSGTESLVASANVFIGQTEAPLLVKPYLKTMTRTEIMTMMTSGMATVAGSVLAAFVDFGISAGHLLAASIMSAPAAIMYARIIYPETEHSFTKGKIDINVEIEDVNAFDAACHGASEGLKLALNVGAMLIAFIALTGLLNLILQHVGGVFGWSITIEEIFGYIFSPLAWVMGVPWQDSFAVGQLLGKKMVINEFVAYSDLANMVKDGELSKRAETIATYALCGFANFSSIAIQIGGIGALEPGRRKDFAQIALKAMLGGTLAAYSTACVAGLLT